LVVSKKLSSMQTFFPHGVETLGGTVALAQRKDKTDPVVVEFSSVDDYSDSLTLYLPPKLAEKLRLGTQYRVQLVPVS